MNIDASAPLTANPITRFASAPNKEEESSTSETSARQENQQIQELKARDRTVRTHEAAHVAAGGSIVRGGANFSFQRGPDGVQYAVGGDVKIDISEENTPEATLRKAEQIRSAALAPAQPSSTDRAVAAKAAQMAIEARAEISQQQSDKSNPENTKLASNEDTAGNNIDIII
ncbi:MAG: hypothetical protein IMF04_01170 [Proteobacteria bacterium]|nr:hypothetical protein [Pseudomonadota bacterium]